MGGTLRSMEFTLATGEYAAARQHAEKALEQVATRMEALPAAFDRFLVDSVAAGSFSLALLASTNPGFVLGSSKRSSGGSAWQPAFIRPHTNLWLASVSPFRSDSHFLLSVAFFATVARSAAVAFFAKTKH